MFCTQCGTEIGQHARFCSKCGKQVEAAAAAAAASSQPQKRTQHDMAMHINILAWLLIGSGVLTAMMSFVVFFAAQVVRHLPIPPPDMPVGMPNFIGWIAGVVGMAMLALAVGVCAAGVGLLQFRDWARTLTVIVAVLLLFHFPIGTAIAVYAFWVLFSKEGQEYFKERSDSTMTMSGT